MLPECLCTVLVDVVAIVVDVVGKSCAVEAGYTSLDVC